MLHLENGMIVWGFETTCFPVLLFAQDGLCAYTCVRTSEATRKRSRKPEAMRGLHFRTLGLVSRLCNPDTAVFQNQVKGLESFTPGLVSFLSRVQCSEAEEIPQKVYLKAS